MNMPLLKRRYGQATLAGWLAWAALSVGLIVVMVVMSQHGYFDTST